MATNWQRGVLRLMGVRNHPVEVVAIDDLTPWYRRLTFSAPTLTASIEAFPTLWLRLWVPNPAKGADAVVQRGYTFVDLDADAGTFRLDFVLHEVPGPAGDWAKSVTLGGRVEAALTPARIDIPEGTTSLVLAGDTTALPAINSWLQAVPSSVSTAVFLEDDHADHEGLPTLLRENGSWEWVAREGPRGAALARAIEARAPQPDGLYAWAAGEKTLVKNVRVALREGRGLDRSRHFTQFYWIEGRATG